jgi:WD40 repeat protein
MVSKRYRKQFTQTFSIQSGGLSSWPVIQNVLSGHSSLVNTVAFSPDGKRIVSGSLDTMIRVWNAGTGEMAAEYGNSSIVNSVVFSPDGKRIASGSSDSGVGCRDW